jgi:hypothetical protein
MRTREKGRLLASAISLTTCVRKREERLDIFVDAILIGSMNFGSDLEGQADAPG